jgi:opacity protein-like surface antigen
VEAAPGVLDVSRCLRGRLLRRRVHLEPPAAFYDASVYSGTTSGANPRPNIDTLDAEIGARAALFFTENLGVEVEGSNIFAKVHNRSQEFASIYGAAIQGMYQLPMGAFTPYVAVGFSMRHVSSPANVLGSDTDWPAHVGIGARYWLAPTVAIRADFRYMRGPEEGHGTDPSYTWGAGYGEFMVGFSFRPRD